MQGLIPDQTSSRCRYLARRHVLRGPFFWSCRSVVLHLLSGSGTESCTGSPSAGLGSVWSGTEIETVGIMSKGRSRRSSALQLGESRPDFPWDRNKMIKSHSSRAAPVFMANVIMVGNDGLNVLVNIWWTVVSSARTDFLEMEAHYAVALLIQKRILLFGIFMV